MSFLKILRSVHRSVPQNAKIGVLEVPFEKGSCYKGSATAPKSLKEFGLINMLSSIDGGEADVKEFKYVPGETSDSNSSSHPVPANMRHYADVAKMTRRISDSCFDIIRDGRACLTLGGDHSIAIGTVSGHARAKSADNVSLVWIDAHADLNTNASTATTNIHGMPVALLAQELDGQWPPAMNWWRKPLISLRNVAYIGLRSVDDFERRTIEELGVAAFSMADVERYGIHTVVKMALNKIDPQSSRSFHLSVDIDALDALEAPSTILPTRGGLSLREGIHIMETVHETGRLGAMDLVEINPTVGTEQDLKKTLEAACELVLAAFGQSKNSLREFSKRKLIR